MTVNGIAYDNKISGLIKQLSVNKVIIFGAGARGKYCAECLSELGMYVCAFFDNNSALWGCWCKETPVIKPQFIENAVVILAIKGRDYELAEQTALLGFSVESLCTYDHVVHLYRERKRDIKAYPHTIQLPITHLCNFDCVMCGMHHMIKRKDFDAIELGRILDDSYYKEVSSIGVNGGEPFLKEDLVDCILQMCDKLPKLKDFFFISNGYFTDRILTKLQEIKRICDDKCIRVHLSLSVDGIGDMQDFHRGKKGAFSNVENTIKELRKNLDNYVNSLDIICTITKYNIFAIDEMLIWEKKNRINVEYNIASENVRIENSDRYEDFSLFSDMQARMMAAEFFYSRYVITGKEKYFGLYLFLLTGRRFTECPCHTNEWITITPDSQIGFCATHSPKLGSGLDESTGIIVSENLNVLSKIKERYCENCAHYGYKLNGEGYAELFRDDLLNNHMLWENIR